MGNKRKTKIKHPAVVEQFAQRLKELRAERGMTQADLAQKTGIAATYISKLESAGAAPGIDLVQKLAEALGVGAADLLPIESPDDPTAIPREQAQELFADLLKVADANSFAVLNPILALLVESAGKRS
jgi:transcriptional regulator with XRE-family HTH domain